MKAWAVQTLSAVTGMAMLSTHAVPPSTGIP